MFGFTKARRNKIQWLAAARRRRFRDPVTTVQAQVGAPSRGTGSAHRCRSVRMGKIAFSSKAEIDALHRVLAWKVIFPICSLYVFRRLIQQRGPLPPVEAGGGRRLLSPAITGG
jgi:hypothetical protein